MKHPTMPRRRIQRAFCQWLAGSREALAIPITVSRRRAGYLECRLTGISTVLKIMLTSYALVVAVERDGECWDLLACFDAVPKKSGEGYVCSFCDPDKRPRYVSREALWRDEIFEPFRTWINDTLAPNEWVACYQIGHGSTWAKIGRGLDNIDPELDYLHAVLPLRLVMTGESDSHG